MGRRGLEAHGQDRTQRTSGTLLPLVGKRLRVLRVWGRAGKSFGHNEGSRLCQAGDMNIEQGVSMLRLA